MDNPIPAVVFGAFLLLVGGGLLAAEVWAGRRRRGAAMERSEQAYYHRRHRRRLQVAGLILLIGVMIPVGDSLIPWEQAATTFAVYWLIVLGLAFWTILLAVGDMLSTKLYADATMNRIHAQRLELEQTAERLRRSNRNGDSA